MYTSTVRFLPCYTAAISLKKGFSGCFAPRPLSATPGHHCGDLICFTQREVNDQHSSVAFAGVAKASSFQSCRELTVWSTPERTLTGHGEVIVRLGLYLGLQSIRLPRLANPLPTMRSFNVGYSGQEFGLF
jgi:hypothetical protein